MPTWWYEVIEGAPGRKRGASSTILKRFWSNSDETWKRKIDEVRQSTNAAWEKLLGLPSDDGFLSVRLEGSASALMRWGYTMVGTISPSLSFEEAHGFFDASVASQGQLFVDGSGALDIEGSVPVTQLFGASGVTDFGWSQPGYLSCSPGNRCQKTCFVADPVLFEYLAPSHLSLHSIWALTCPALAT